ncbi:MAG: ribosomal protein L18, bacterial type [Candidatus Berkelbacteria bacterium Licking1014_85]|uniref:Large ribosomal subunit protein uL18 n=1 Tax=Candidatus Berkelbacteria bacterium Licking1014_85 TaxID=2017148 RepID=A0A554LM34_9BACT|nr:MAG: ribosomal protein L18, bacterial type [Candidatus Berkelbacteria bacterium Licking1014_85]
MNKRIKKIRNTSKIKFLNKQNFPVLKIFRSLTNIYAQVVIDSKVVASTNSLKIAGNKMDKSRQVGSLIADKLLKNKIHQVIFDRGTYKYHGRVKVLAESAREKGLKI